MDDERTSAVELNLIAHMLGEPGNDDDLTQAMRSIATALKWLGNADASTPMGALEAFGVVMMEGLAGVARGLTDVAEAIRDSANSAPMTQLQRVERLERMVNSHRDVDDSPIGDGAPSA